MPGACQPPLDLAQARRLELNQLNVDLIIRPVQHDDAQAINGIATHPDVARTLLQLPSKELAQTEHLLAEPHPGLHRLVAQKNGAVVGMVTLNQPQNPRRFHSGGLGLMVHPDYWRQGIGSALLHAILDLADNWLNLIRVELTVQPDNLVAIHLYESLGFVLEGRKKSAVLTDGRYSDQLVMARLQENRPRTQSAMQRHFPKRTDVVAINIRPTQVSDAADLYEILSHPAVCFGTNQLPSQEITLINERLRAQDPGAHRFSAVALHEDGSSKIVGNLGLHQHQKARMAHGAWIGMSIHPKYWGLGIGSQLMEKALDLADNWLGLKRLELEVLVDNPGAIHLYEKYGFEKDGSKRLYSYGAGRWADSLFMARISHDQR